MAISAALTPEAARSVLVLGFNVEAEMHHPTKFKQNQAVCGSFIDDSTNLRFRRDFVARGSQSRVDRTKLNLGRSLPFSEGDF